jgi:hypothetical protein
MFPILRDVLRDVHKYVKNYHKHKAVAGLALPPIYFSGENRNGDLRLTLIIDFFPSQKMGVIGQKTIFNAFRIKFCHFNGEENEN